MDDLGKRNHRIPWTAEAEAELRQRIAAGQFVPEIAEAMGRSQESIRTRANILRISVRFAAERRPRRRRARNEEPATTTPSIARQPPS